MTAVKVIDIISRLPGCEGQAADAVSAKTKVKMEDAPTLLKIPKSECSDFCIVRDPRGSRTCVCANIWSGWVAHAGREGRSDVLPWYRLVGVAKTSSQTQRRKNRAARKVKWSPRGTGNQHAPPILEV